MPVSISIQSWLRLALVAILIAAVFYLKSIFLVLLPSIGSASFVESGVRKFKKIGMGRVVSVIFIYLIVIAALAAIFYTFVPILISELSDALVFLSKNFPQATALIGDGAVNDARRFVTSITNDASLPTVISRGQALLENLSGGFVSAVSSIFGSIVNVLLLFIISFYLSMQESGIENFIKIIAPKNKEEYAIDLWHRAERKIGHWVEGQLLLGIILGLIVFGGLSIVGVKYALLAGAFSAILGLIPFGSIIAAVPGIIFAFLDGGIALMTVVAAFYAAVHYLEAYVLSPAITKRVAGISPLVVILSILIGAELAGFWGILLAVPVAVFLLEYFSDQEQEKEKIG